jgi:hypothetical protein
MHPVQVPDHDKKALEVISSRLASLKDANSGIHFATIGWILTVPADRAVLVVEDPIGSENERHDAWRDQRR